MLLLATAVSWAQSDAPIVDQAEALLRAGRYAEVYALLAPNEQRLAGSPRFDYLLARSALETGRPRQAIALYERILAVEPNYLGVRLELGRAYYAVGEYGRARLEFETVLHFEQLPPDLRRQAQAYSRAAERQAAGRKTLVAAYLEYGYGYDSNPLSATPVGQIGLPGGGTLILPQNSLTRADHYQVLTAGGELVRVLSDRLSIVAAGEARGRSYRDFEAAEYGSVDGRIGMGYGSGVHYVRATLNGGRFWLDDDRMLDKSGATVEYRYRAGRQDQISVDLGGSRYRFAPGALRTQSYDLYLGTLGWLHVSSDGRSTLGFTLLAGKEAETAGRADGDRTFAGARTLLQRSLTEQIAAFVLAGTQRGAYRQVNLLFGERRRETFFELSAGASWVFAKGWSLRPQVQYLRNRANLPLFEFERTDISLNLRWDS